MTAEIKATRVRKQKRDREDARLLLKLLRENRFPRVWVPPPENRDLRQLLWHRHRLGSATAQVPVEPIRASEVGIAPAGSLGRKASKGSAGAVGPLNAQDRGAQRGVRAGSMEPTRSAAPDDAPRRWTRHGSSICADHRNTVAFCLRQADRQLPGTYSVRGLQWWSSAAGAHQ